MLSLLSLYLELFFIRWLCADVWAFGVFKSFPLVACFVGLGVGYANSKRPLLIQQAPFALLLFCLLMKLSDAISFSQLPFPSATVWTFVSALVSPSSIPYFVVAFMVGLFVLLGGLFVVMFCVGAKIGALFDAQQPLYAYCINICGAIAGSILFTICSFLQLSPGLLLVPVALLMFVYCNGQKTWRRSGLCALALIGSIGCAAYTQPMFTGARTYWSPYQRLDLARRFVSVQGKPIYVGYVLLANRYPYQQVMDLNLLNHITESNELPVAALSEIDGFVRRYSLPFLLHSRLDDVLVVGSGMGMDVAEALKFGAKHVDAVDIDPLIIKLGRKYNAQHPYDSNNVDIYCDDARHFFNTCSKKYDLIAFSYLDSFVVTASSVRLDNFVYTQESIQKALSLLKPDGLVVISFNNYKNWFNDRLFATILSGAGYPPYEFCDERDLQPAAVNFILGMPVKDGTFKLPDALQRHQCATGHNLAGVRILTDDWPYLYVTPGSTDLPYLLVVAEVLLLSMFSARKILFGRQLQHDWQMFFLGAGFLLLELMSISRLSLVYGATWLTTAVVVNGVLILILFANLLVMRIPAMQSSAIHNDLKTRLYAVLFVCLAASYMLPAITGAGAGWLPQHPVIAASLITAITLSPMFFASMIFALAFRGVDSASTALSFNMLGAVAGGMLEYLSNYTGIRSLSLVAFILYGLSLLAMNKHSARQRGVGIEV